MFVFKLNLSYKNVTFTVILGFSAATILFSHYAFPVGFEQEVLQSLVLKASIL